MCQKSQVAFNLALTDGIGPCQQWAPRSNGETAEHAMGSCTSGVAFKLLNRAIDAKDTSVFSISMKFFVGETVRHSKLSTSSPVP